jgi:hypothetical protein
MTGRYGWLAAAGLTSLLMACSNDSTGVDPGSGTAVLRLSTPLVDDGAVLFTLSGPPIDSATPVNPSLRLFTRQANDSTLVGALIGNVAAGAVITLHGAADPGRYVVRVVEVADRDDLLRETLIGYALTVIR